MREVQRRLRDEIITTKFDLDDLLDSHAAVREKAWQAHPLTDVLSGVNCPQLDVFVLLGRLVPSYIAPALHYNTYVDALLADKDMFGEEAKYEPFERPSIRVRRLAYQVPAQALLLSIKSALDRLVVLFSYYYRGVSVETTFGRLNEKGKARGLMARAVEAAAEDDPLMLFVRDQYHNWIRAAVEPRDLITHYNDLGLTCMVLGGAELPAHMAERLVSSEREEVGTWHVGSLHRVCENWYAFFDRVVPELISRDIVISRRRITA